MKFSRHSKNRVRQMQRHGLSVNLEDIEAALDAIGDPFDYDDDGNPRYGIDFGDVAVRIVRAAVDPDFIVTVHNAKRSH